MDQTKFYLVKETLKGAGLVVEKNLYNKHLVYKLWVSDCGTETGDKEKAQNVTPTTPFPFQLTIWIYFLKFLFFPFKFTEVNLL